MMMSSIIIGRKMFKNHNHQKIFLITKMLVKSFPTSKSSVWCAVLLYTQLLSKYLAKKLMNLKISSRLLFRTFNKRRENKQRKNELRIRKNMTHTHITLSFFSIKEEYMR